MAMALTITAWQWHDEASVKYSRSMAAAGQTEAVTSLHWHGNSMATARQQHGNSTFNSATFNSIATAWQWLF